MVLPLQREPSDHIRQRIKKIKKKNKNGKSTPGIMYRSLRVPKFDFDPEIHFAPSFVAKFNGPRERRTRRLICLYLSLLPTPSPN
ncbi:hypothetical protein OnM2_097003 [Erysiphe neolycopersici]|uniref:Uncharacterized protein n=1 Tax=Erysiphe neolycopersici TaxID=212602 RepID=A0A420HAP5_9PEZI|nr:hypothetical protein OnM2_097003 [Erysiphe neolycopersici]